jgi:hypothetical protein
MSWVLFTLFAMQGLSVRTTTPLDLCPTVDAVEAALSERANLVSSDQEHWQLVLTSAHRTTAPAADFLRVQLLDAQEQARIDQQLDVSGADCGVRAQTVALIVADYFESLRLDPVSHPEPATQLGAPGADAKAKASPEPPPAPVAFSAKDAERTNSKPERGRLVLGLGVSTTDGFSPGFAARVAVAVRSAWDISVLMLAPVHTHDTLKMSGHAEGWGFPVRLSAGYHLASGRLDSWLGPEALFSYERGTVSGIANSQTNERLVVGAGAQAGIRWRALDSLAPYLLVAVDYQLPLAGSRFTVDHPNGRSEDVLAEGPVRWGAALGIDYDLH